MKKVYLLIIFMITFVLNCNGAEKNVCLITMGFPLEMYELKGQVKEFTELENLLYNDDKKKWENEDSDKSLPQNYRFNKNGYLTMFQVCYYGNYDGKTYDTQLIYNYNDDGTPKSWERVDRYYNTHTIYPYVKRIVNGKEWYINSKGEGGAGHSWNIEKKDKLITVSHFDTGMLPGYIDKYIKELKEALEKKPELIDKFIYREDGSIYSIKYSSRYYRFDVDGNIIDYKQLWKRNTKYIYYSNGRAEYTYWGNNKSEWTRWLLEFVRDKNGNWLTKEKSISSYDGWNQRIKIVRTVKYY